MRVRRAAFAASAAVLCAGAASAAVDLSAASASTTTRATLAGTAAPAKVRTHPAGAVAGSSRVDFDLALALRDRSGAEALVKAVSTPGSAQYRQYLTAAQWEARYSPTSAHVAQAEAWLRQEGFTVGSVSPDRMTISASGTAAQIESAFATGLTNYKVAGHTLRLATGNLSVPSTLAGIVVGAVGINQTVARPAVGGDRDIPGSTPSTTTSSSPSGAYPPPPPVFLTSPPCSNYYGQKTTTTNPPYPYAGYPTTVPDVVCGYKPQQLRSAYNVPAADTGKGATIAIVDAYDSATIKQDATQYFASEDPGAPFSNAHFRQNDMSSTFSNQAECAASSWLDEQAIDVEGAHGVAPNANVVYVGAKSCLDPDLFAAEQKVIDKHLADVVSNSWGDTGGDLLVDSAEKTAYDDLFIMAADTGISVQFSSGDDLDNFDALGFSSPDYPASSPFVVAVGGTSLEVGQAGQRIGELGWSTGRSVLCTSNIEGSWPGCDSSTLNTWLPPTDDGGSGGYTSYTYLQPPWQAGVVPTALSERNAAIFGPTPLRVVPDISAVADPGTGFLIGLTQTLFSGKTAYEPTRYGGTSLASPVLAGIVADTDQQGGQSVGLYTPTIYQLEGASAIYDVKPPATPQGNYRVDRADMIFGPSVSGPFDSYRELVWEGNETYCDTTGNCATRRNPLTTAPGYDSMTGLGSPGSNFVNALATLG